MFDFDLYIYQVPRQPANDVMPGKAYEDCVRMDEECYKICEGLIPCSYVKQGQNAKLAHQNKIRLLLEKKKIPDDGWDDMSIELLLQELAVMDSNNFSGNCGVGEREARVFSNLVSQRHYRFGHGIGRSGEITAVQPKAAGSSIMATLTNKLALHAIKLAGITLVKKCFVVPMATGMCLTLCMLTLKQKRPTARFVIWPRIDQKSCLKSISTAGLEAVVIENKIEGDELRTDVEAIEDKIAELGAENILCVLTTTSCFAPRTPDRLEEVGAICKEKDVPQLVNNAYGLQCSKCTHLVQQGSKTRLDLFVQSTDKNFLVPVGGSIIAGFDESLIDNVSKCYPGRASGSPSMDLFITLLSMGVKGYKELLQQRKANYQYMAEKLAETAAMFGEKLLDTKHNGISMALSLSKLDMMSDVSQVTEVGSKLFTRLVSGTRVVAKSGKVTEICGLKMKNFGSHSNSYPSSYLTAAASIGMRKDEVDLFINRLDKVLTNVYTEKNQS
ncbi:hypothetical protein FSP39_025255 [Pinctada imbricata]|uniref:O-phosphoseryl-tRNA(Sec) selenium transferase n=1 Tax=Pinctada imbricata TaxID=66713 RepID=A0AA88YC04_PINIB|nr:hypothetical protein FSP39_025255 [Pinctada imbricata]